MGLLTRIRRLDLSNNHLSELPEAIGYLDRLEYLNLSHNKLACLPDTICHLVKLKEIDVSFNLLTCMTPYVGHLVRLQALYLANNQLDQLPFSLDGLQSLMMLDLSHNPVRLLPAQVVQLPFLRRIRLEGCPLVTEIPAWPAPAQPPSLLELCARQIVRHGLPHAQLTERLQTYLTTYHLCCHCHGPYFDAWLRRGRWLEKNDAWIPLEYRLCNAHWSTEQDRVFATFSSPPPQLHPLLTQGGSKPNLLSQKHPANTFLHKKFVVSRK
ncbi:hypothetical protein BY458DRAFT_502237 [Sporodiniella umbellata]|nr:hypothetical protein BY458DRAFT_502237 [Sporodiniella umbellata]